MHCAEHEDQCLVDLAPEVCRSLSILSLFTRTTLVNVFFALGVFLEKWNVFACAA